MNTQTKDIERIIIRHLLKETTVEEQKLLLHWLKEDIKNQDYFFNLKATWDNSGPMSADKANTDEDCRQLHKLLFPERIKVARPKNQPVFLRALKYAAGVIFLTGVGTALYLLLNRPVAEDPIIYTEFKTSYGEKKEITLPDNTTVWLNSGTILKYPSNYGKINREVVLQGEAFFDVARDESKTFIVKADNIIIRVLGTSFNVNCYHEQKTVETTVVSGIVSLESNTNSPEKSIVILNKSEKATYVKNENKIIKDNNDNNRSLKANPIEIKKISLGEETINALTGWKDQDLIFDNETLEEMALKLRRWYNVSIVIKDEHLKQYRYKGRFNDVKSIFQVLEVVKLATPITYEYDENKKEIIIKEMK